MIWYFTRGSAQIDVEVLRRPAGGYTLQVTYPDGSERIEDFEDAARLVTRTLSMQQGLIDEGWIPWSPLGGRTPAPRRLPRGARIRYVRIARRAVVQFHRTVTRRLAAAFGL